MILNYVFIQLSAENLIEALLGEKFSFEDLHIP